MQFRKISTSRLSSYARQRRQMFNDLQPDAGLQIMGQSIPSPKAHQHKIKLQQSQAEDQPNTHIDYKQITAHYNEINPYLDMILTRRQDSEAQKSRPISGLFQETYKTLDKKENVMNTVKEQLHELQMNKLSQRYQ